MHLCAYVGIERLVLIDTHFSTQCDPGERLTQCSASLQALLGLNQSSWMALSKLLGSNSGEAADEIIALFRQVSVLMQSSSSGSSHKENTDHPSSEPLVEVPVNVRLWRVPGCHELLASLGFDLMEVVSDGDTVILKTGKAANRRQIHYGLQALLALFETQDAPRSLEIEDDSDSTEGEDEVDGGASAAVPPEMEDSPFSILRYAISMGKKVTSGVLVPQTFEKIA